MERKSYSSRTSDASASPRSEGKGSQRSLPLEKIISPQGSASSPSEFQLERTSHQDNPSTSHADKSTRSPEQGSPWATIDLKPVKIPLWTKTFDLAMPTNPHRPERVNQIAEKINTFVTELQTTLASDHFSAEEKTEIEKHVASLVKDAQASYKKALQYYGKDMGWNTTARNNNEKNLYSIYREVKSLHDNKKAELTTRETNHEDLKADQEIAYKVEMAEKGIYDPKEHEKLADLYRAADQSLQAGPSTNESHENLMRHDGNSEKGEIGTSESKLPYVPEIEYKLDDSNAKGLEWDRRSFNRKVYEAHETISELSKEEDATFRNDLHSLAREFQETFKQAMASDDNESHVARLSDIVTRLEKRSEHLNFSEYAEPSTSHSLDILQDGNPEDKPRQQDREHIIAHANEKLALAQTSRQSFDRSSPYISAEDRPLVDTLTQKAIAAAHEAHQQLIDGPQEGIDLSLAQKRLDEASNWLQDTPAKIQEAYAQQIERMMQKNENHSQQYNNILEDFQAEQQNTSTFTPADRRQQLADSLTTDYRLKIQRLIADKKYTYESRLDLRAHELAMAKEKLAFLDGATFLSPEESNMLSDYTQNMENLSTELSTLREGYKQFKESEQFKDPNQFKYIQANFDMQCTRYNARADAAQLEFAKALQQQGWLPEVASTSEPGASKKKKTTFEKQKDNIKVLDDLKDEQQVNHAEYPLSELKNIKRGEQESDQSYQKRQEVYKNFHDTRKQFEETFETNYEVGKDNKVRKFLPENVEDKLIQTVDSLCSDFEEVHRQVEEGEKEVTTLDDHLTRIQKIKEDLDVWKKIPQEKYNFNEKIASIKRELMNIDHLPDEIADKYYENLDQLEKLHDDHHTSLENQYENTLSFNQADQAAIEQITDQAQAMYDTIDQTHHTWQKITSAYEHADNTIQNIANKLNELTENKLPHLFHEKFNEAVVDFDTCYQSLLEDYTKDFSVRTEDKGQFDNLHRDIQDLSKELDKYRIQRIQDAKEKINIAVQQYVPEKYQYLVHELTNRAGYACEQLLENDQPDAREQFETTLDWLKKMSNELTHVGIDQQGEKERQKEERQQGELQQLQPESITRKLEKPRADHEILLACLGSENVSIIDQNINATKTSYINDMDTLMGKIVTLQDEGKIAEAYKCAEQFISTKQAFEHSLKKQGLLSEDYDNLSKIEEIETQLDTLKSKRFFQREGQSGDSSKLPRPERLKKNLEQFEAHFKELSTTLKKSNLPVKLEAKVVEVTSSLADNLHTYSTYIMRSYKYDLLRPGKKSRDKAEAKLQELTVRIQEVKSDFSRLHNTEKCLDTAEQYHASQEAQNAAHEKFEQAKKSFEQVLDEHHERSSSYQDLRLQLVISSREVQEKLQLPSKANAMMRSVENITNYIAYAKESGYQGYETQQEDFAHLCNEYHVKLQYIKQEYQKQADWIEEVDNAYNKYTEINDKYQQAKRDFKKEKNSKNDLSDIKDDLKTSKQELSDLHVSIKNHLAKLEENPVDRIDIIDTYFKDFQQLEQDIYKKLLENRDSDRTKRGRSRSSNKITRTNTTSASTSRTTQGY